MHKIITFISAAAIMACCCMSTAYAEVQVTTDDELQATEIQTNSIQNLQAADSITLAQDEIAINLALCGNGTVDQGEDCDPGGDITNWSCSSTVLGCTQTCQCLGSPPRTEFASCGDEIWHPNQPNMEQCDKRMSQNLIESQCKFMYSNPSMTMIRCGDHDPNDPNSDPVEKNCKCLFCGDNIYDPSTGEECGEPNAPNCISGSMCVDCKCLPSCGEYGWNQLAGEECDNSDTLITISDQCKTSQNLVTPPLDATCDATCQCHYCGDGDVEGTEQCEGTDLLRCPQPVPYPGWGSCDDDCQCVKKELPEIGRLPRCGDGVVNMAGEQCEGTDLSRCSLPVPPLGWTCDATTCLCVPVEGCGDGNTDTAAGEQCDAAATLMPDCIANSGFTGAEPNITCAACNCQWCGDGTWQPANGEDCDGTDMGNCLHGCDTATCTCKPAPYCGDGNPDPGEGCDPLPAGSVPGPDSTCGYMGYCRANCICAYCGDGLVNTPSEVCDGTNTTNCGLAPSPLGWACDANCQCEAVTGCGDGNLDAGEECDDPGTMDTDCDANSGYTSGDPGLNCVACQCEWCGDGIKNGAEDCDGTQMGICLHGCDTATCTCMPAPFCGDGNLDAGEECDDPGTMDADCDANSGYTSGDPGLSCVGCKCEWCGDGIKNGAEDCDGTQMGICPNGCDQTNCTCTPAPTCGNGTVDTALGEQCDDPGTISSDCATHAGYNGTDPGLQCSSCLCQWCGDGTTNGAEDCDKAKLPDPLVDCTSPPPTWVAAQCDNNCGCVYAPPPHILACNHDNTADPSEECDGTDVSKCPVPGSTCDGNCHCEPPPPVTVCNHDNTADPSEECDGTDVTKCPIAGSTCDANCHCTPPPHILACNHDNTADPSEECDGTDVTKCPIAGSTCDGNCHCKPPSVPTGPVCGNGTVETGEKCDPPAPAPPPSPLPMGWDTKCGMPPPGEAWVACSALCECVSKKSGIPTPICGNDALDVGEMCDIVGGTPQYDPNICPSVNGMGQNLVGCDSPATCRCLYEGEPTTGIPDCGNFVVESGETCDADPSDPATFAQAMKKQCGSADAVCIHCACVDPKPGCSPDGCCPPQCGDEPERPPLVDAASCIVEWNGGATPGSIKELEKINKKINKEALNDTRLKGRVFPVGEAEFTTMKLTAFLPGTVVDGSRPKAIKVGDASMGSWMVLTKDAKLNDFWVKKYRPAMPETTGWVRLAPLTQADFTAAGKTITNRALKKTLKSIVLPDLSSDVMSSLGIEAGGTIDSVLSLGADAQVVSDTMVKVNNVAVVEITPMTITKAAGATSMSKGSVTMVLQPIAAGFTAVEGYGGYKGNVFDVDTLIEAIKNNVAAKRAAGQEPDCSVLLVKATDWPQYQNYQMKFVQDQLSGDPAITDLSQTDVSGAFYGVNLAAAKGTGGCSLTAAAPSASHAMMLIGMLASGIAGLVAVRRKKKL